MGRLEGKVTVVTGAGSGIGRAGAHAYAREGASVGVLGRTASKVEAVVADIGPAAFPLACDLSDEEQVIAAFDEVRRRLGRLDVLYNVAGVQLYGEDAAVHDLELEVFERTYRNNVRGTFLASKHGSRLMIDGGGGGSIILTGSPTGLTMVGADFAAYSSSKAAVGGLARSMAGALGQARHPCQRHRARSDPDRAHPEALQRPGGQGTAAQPHPARRHRRTDGHGRDRGPPRL